MANVPNSRGVCRDEHKSPANREGVTDSVAETVGGSRCERNESQSSPKDPHANDEEGRLSPDFYSDWYFEMKDLERTKFLRGILEWHNGGGNRRRGESGECKVVDQRHRLLRETFRVKMLSGKRTKVKVILAISLDAVEMKVDRDSDPGGVALPKGLDIPLRVDAREILGCEVVKRKSRDRTMFRIISRSEDGPGGGGNNKQNYFECESATAEKIMEMLHGVLEVKASSFREEYLETLQKEKEKSGMRRIFGFGCG